MDRRKIDEINSFEDNSELDDKRSVKSVIEEKDLSNSNDKDDEGDYQNKKKKLSTSEIIFAIAFFLLIAPICLTHKTIDNFGHTSEKSIVSNDLGTIMWATAIGLLLFNWLVLKDKTSKGCLKYLIIFVAIVLGGGFMVYYIISSLTINI